MSINIGPDPSDDLRPRITVIGVGGAGGNAIANMMEADIEGVDFIVANTDAQSLSTSPAAFVSDICDATPGSASASCSECLCPEELWQARNLLFQLILG